MFESPLGGRYVALVNSARDILWETDAGGAFTFLNASTIEICGYLPEEMIGRTPADFVAERDRTRVAERFADHFARREPLVLFACTARAKNGHLVDIEINGDPFFDAAGELLGYRGVARDVTARNQLRAEQLHLAYLVDSANDAVMSKDLEDRITYWNRGAERIFGYSAAEMIGSHVSDMAPDNLKEESARLTRRMLAGDRIQNHRTVRRRKDGSPIDISITYSPIYGPTGAIVGTSAIAKDISDRVQLEREVAARTALQETELALSPDGILVVDADRMVTSYNPQFLEMWNLPPESYLDGTDADTLAVAVTLVTDPKEFLARVEYLYAHPEEKGFDELAMKDGRVFQRYSAAMTGHDGTYLGRLWYFRDITGQRAAEASARAELERYGRSMAATVEAVAGIAELRDPYTSGHQRRVSATAVALAHKLGLSAHDIEGIRIAGLLHDIGKIGIPSEILSKPGRLSTAEFELLKGHPGAGYDILKGIEFPWPVAEMVFQHHERLDGTGYPRGLKGDQILLGARILTVADVSEAMISHRPYRPAMGRDLAFAELRAGRGFRYDAAVVDACFALFEEDGFLTEPPHPPPPRIAEERRKAPRLDIRHVVPEA